MIFALFVAFVQGQSPCSILQSCSSCLAGNCTWCGYNDTTAFLYDSLSACIDPTMGNCTGNQQLPVTSNASCAFDQAQHCQAYNKCTACSADASCKWCQSNTTTAVFQSFSDTCQPSSASCSTGLLPSTQCLYDKNANYSLQSSCNQCVAVGGGVWCPGVDQYGSNYTFAGTCNFGLTCLAPNAGVTPFSTTSACNAANSGSVSVSFGSANSSDGSGFTCGGQPVGGLSALALVFSLLECVQQANPSCAQLSGTSVNATQMTTAMQCVCFGVSVRCLAQQSPSCAPTPDTVKQCEAMGCSESQCDSSVPLLSIGIMLMAVLRYFL